MKNLKSALCVALVFFLAIIAYQLINNTPAKNRSIAQHQTALDMSQESKISNQEPVAKSTIMKNNSFSVGTVFGEKPGNLDVTQAMVNRGKHYLLTQVDNRIRQLEPFKVKVEKTDSLNESDRSSLVSELNAEIAMFETLKPEITQSITKEDVKNVADKIKAEWLKSRQSVERAEKLIFASKENQFVSDAEATSLSIQKRLDALKAAGKETKAQDRLLSAYDKKIAEAKQDIESANKKTSAATNASTNAEKETLMKEKDLLMKKSQENIRDAYKLLKEEAHKDFSRKVE